MKKYIKKLITIIIALIIIAIIAIVFLNNSNGEEIQNVHSERQLLNFYEKSESSHSIPNWAKQLLSMPFSLNSEFNNHYISKRSSGLIDDAIMESGTTRNILSTVNAKSNTSSSKDFSTTNIQVENVDEADITKTDGNYIYSISDNQVIITNVINPEKPIISARINIESSSYPEDLILYKNKLVVISQEAPTNSSHSYYSYNSNTKVCVYNIENKKYPIVEKKYDLYEPYYTSRCINNKLYVIASGVLRKENDKILRKYKEDNIEKEIVLNDIKYLKDIKTDKQTIFSTCDLDDVKKDVKIKSYLIDISNAYVSEKSFYLLDGKYEGYHENPEIKDLFGPGGIIGFFNKYVNYNYNSYYDNYGYKTKVYKFDIQEDGNIKYVAKTKIDGKTINQYSLDEKNGHLRIALSDDEGSRIIILDENLNKIGQTENLAKGENMYSSRFIGDKAYLVTYRVVDPLWVIDLSNEKDPKVLGELKIPGYSTYIHPYDENHIIGIGMETKEKINRNSFGRVISNTATIVGMKMALFDVTDVNNPKQIFSTVIGDSRTTSAILTNPKALLFSKEKQLIAIPVNNYERNFEVNNNANTYDSLISAYKTESSYYIGEGYLVYKINLEEGFKQKGVITHASTKKTNSNNYYYYYTQKMLRGIYIDNNLYTVSESAIKVNSLEDLKLISEVEIRDN